MTPINSMRRVMILSDGYPPNDRGGADRIAYYHAQGLKKRGWDIAVLCAAFPGEYCSKVPDTVEGVKVYRVFRINPFSQSVTANKLDKAYQLSASLWNPLLTKPVEAAVDHFKPDLLHAHHIPSISYRVFSNVSSHLPKILTFHNYQFECPKGGLFRKHKNSICGVKPLPCTLFQSGMKSIIRPVDRIIAISRFIEERLLNSGYNSTNISYIPNGIPDLRSRVFTPPSQYHNILYVGRLDRNKGVDILINTFLKLDQPAATLTIIGDGPSRNYLEYLSQGDLRIQFLGWKPHGEVAHYYCRSRLVVVPSIWHEVMNTVVCEAQSWGRPVIASQVGGNSDIIKHGVTGFLYRHDDTKSLLHLIIQLLTDDSETDLLGRNAFHYIRQFSMSKHLDSLIELYDEIKC